MKNYIIVLLLCVFSSNAFAQKITYSKPIKLTGKTPKFKILGRNANYFVAERWGAKIHYLDLYNANLKKVSSKELRLDSDEYLRKIWIQPKKGWVIYSKLGKEKSFLCAKQLDVNLNIKTTPLVLDSLVERKDFVETNFRTTLSLNEMYFAAYIPVFSKGSLDYLSVNVYDENLKEVQKLELKNQFITDGTFVDLLVLNNGAVVAIFLEKESNNRFKVYYSDQNRNLFEYTLNLENEVYKKTKFEVDNLNNQLLIAGLNLYQQSKKVQGADAFFTLKMDLSDGGLSEKSAVVFDKKLYKLLTEKEAKTDKINLQTFYIKTIVPKMDGGYLVFLESYYENEEIFETPQSNSLSNAGNSMLIGQTSFSSINTYKTNFYFFNDVIVYTINNNMEVESANIIKKRQKSEEDSGGYSSFSIVNQQNMLEILFLDEISTNSSLKRYTLNQDSEIFNGYLLNVSQNDVMPVVKLALQTAPNEILLPSYLNNSFSLIKIVFEDNK